MHLDVGCSDRAVPVGSVVPKMSRGRKPKRGALTLRMTGELGKKRRQGQCRFFDCVAHEMP